MYGGCWLLNGALKDKYSMFEGNNDCWLHCVHLIFREVNMLNVFHNLLSPSKKNTMFKKKKLKQRFES